MRKNKILKTCLISSVVVGIIFFYLSYLFLSIEGKIVEDELLLEVICKIRPLCYIANGTMFFCKNIENKQVSEKLLEWENFKGCNNSTKGYLKDGYVTGIESCVCPNIIG